MFKVIKFIVNSDKRLFNLINGIRSTILDILMPVFTFYGSIWLAIPGGGLLLLLWPNIGIKAVAALTGNIIIVKTIKKKTYRHRPYIAIPDSRALGYLFKDYSFPSGHTGTACAISVILSHGFPEFTALWITLAILTGISRIYQGQHYPTDVFAGAFIGCTAGFLSITII